MSSRICPSHENTPTNAAQLCYSRNAAEALDPSLGGAAGAARLPCRRRYAALVGAEVLAEMAGALLQEHGLKQSDIRFWILHSAGRRVLDRARGSLGLNEQDLQYSREVFRNFGNMSSATVLFVLDQVMTSGRPQPGDLALMAAMGAGFAAEGALLRWVQ